jgi:hypothetical protein
MTQASNLANFANNLNSSGQVDPNAFSSLVPITKGGTNASNITDARANLQVPKTDGTGATGTWGIGISGNSATATNATNASKMVTTNWIVEENSGVLNIKTAEGIIKFSMDTTNGFTVY